MALVLLKDDQISVKASVGTTMRKVAQATGASMEFGCRVGDCATCVATVERGMEYLSPLTEKERKAMSLIENADEKMRLMCQCSVISEEGEIEISYIHSC
ncbi:MAG TPA: 2Fe-2S iron-sulfur cluster binding domain-containing protein [Campylobacteraceae bacterium]|nr:2Fe-2S iron-sulfur cluster binding domain-containing protein [Campylobacteraceae bacterium]